MIFTNNDVLVPRGAIDNIKRDLKNEIIVVPLSSAKGAGHNPPQVRVL